MLACSIFRSAASNICALVKSAAEVSTDSKHSLFQMYLCDFLEALLRVRRPHVYYGQRMAVHYGARILQAQLVALWEHRFLAYGIYV